MSIITYGQTVYFKNQGEGIQERWLCGCRGVGNKGVRTDDKDEEPDKIKCYQWQMWKRWDEAGNGKVNCGDYVFLKCVYMDDKWLSGGRGKENKQVLTYDGSTQFGASYEWRVSHDPASVDPRKGIEMNEDIHLRVGVVSNPELFLCGGRGRGNKGVRTQEYRDKPSYFRWRIQPVPRT